MNDGNGDNVLDNKVRACVKNRLRIVSSLIQTIVNFDITLPSASLSLWVNLYSSISLVYIG